MNGFESMARQFVVEDVSKELDQMFGGINHDVLNLVVPHLQEALNVLHEEGEDLHPLEITIAIILKLVVVAYLLAGMGGVAEISLELGPLFVMAIDMNDGIDDVAARIMRKKMENG